MPQIEHAATLGARHAAWWITALWESLRCDGRHVCSALPAVSHGEPLPSPFQRSEEDKAEELERKLREQALRSLQKARSNSCDDSQGSSAAAAAAAFVAAAN